MEKTSPFVIAVASEKGGVGKTTIATNLAVYLKALREDLPVTVASFDNHFSVDNMFAIGRHQGASVAGLFNGIPAAELVQLGEYGVQFLASERHLDPPDGDLERLAGALATSMLPGILVLDTRPILDYFTRNALRAADLVLVPVKDRASLVNVASLKSALSAGGDEAERLWLVPSLIDARLRLRQEVGMRDFLTFSARERGYQVVETFIAKSPKVEGLATGFSSRVYPVLTHARSTAVHRQLRDLARFVLSRFDVEVQPRCLGVTTGNAEEIPPGRHRRLLRECPVCTLRNGGEEGFLVQDLRSRRRAFIHRACFEGMLPETLAEETGDREGMLALAFAGPGLVGPDGPLSLFFYNRDGEEGASCRPGKAGRERFRDLWQTVSGRPVEESYREVLVVYVCGGAPRRFLAAEGYDRFDSLRRKVVREALLNSG